MCIRDRYVGDDIYSNDLKKIIQDTLSFNFPIIEITDKIALLELFHGPTLAFKDVGARFMARCLSYNNDIKKEGDLTILVATSGDTGGAVADGFYKVKGIDVIILYPKGKVSDIQERQLTTLGENIIALEVDGTFDDCQEMVKSAFVDPELKENIKLTSANSINIARWLSQMFYYFIAYKNRPNPHKDLIVSVPSGNFGNLCAGLVAHKMGLPIKHFIACTNINDTLPRYLDSGNYEPKKSISTISNAMDVGDPSNFIRIQKLFNNDFKKLKKKIVSIIGTFMVSVKEGGDPQKGLNIGEFGSSAIMIVVMYFLITCTILDNAAAMNIFYATLIGLAAGLGIGLVTEHYTGTGTKPVQSVVDQSITGAATNIIAGLGVGMQSTFLPMVIIAIAIVGAHSFAGLYGVAMAALGMLANTGIQLAVDAYGPISDNAGGIAEMAELEPEVRERTDKLDAVGNTTAAIGKGFAIGSAALTTLALFAAFSEVIKAKTGTPLIINISEPIVMAALFIGAMLPFLFSSMAMGAVGRAAMSMIEEVRRQFRDIPELKAALKVMKKGDESSWSESDKKTYEDGLDKAEHDKCVEISTQAAIKEMMLPGLLAVISPIIIGLIGNQFNMGPQALGG